MTQNVRWGAPGEPDSTEAPLRDPYWAAPTPPAPPATSQLGVTSLLTLLLGPVGSIASIFFGWAARREILRGGKARRGLWMAHTGMVLGAVLSVAWIGAVGWIVVQRQRAALTLSDTSETDGSDPAIASPDPLAPQPGPIPTGPVPMAVAAPKTTKLAHVGGIEVADIGTSTTSLKDELARQRAAASKAGEQLLLMTTAGNCDPCRGVDRSLEDQLLQTALEHVRLVRVDVGPFAEDLEAMNVPIKAIPGFFLLSPDLTPKDGINGGEWGDDVPTNIAPVLGPFVRGKLTKRRESWRPLPGSGIRL